MEPHPETRQPSIVLILSIVTCGIYLIYWYYCVYEEMESLAGQTPTGQIYLLDFLFTLLTCGIYGIWVDYRLAQQLYELQIRYGVPYPQHTGTMTILLDVGGYASLFFANFVSSAIHQDQLNKIHAVAAQRP